MGLNETFEDNRDVSVDTQEDYRRTLEDLPDIDCPRCFFCEKQFQTMHELGEHTCSGYNEVVEGEFSCPYCLIGIKSEQELEIHMKSHQDVKSGMGNIY